MVRPAHSAITWKGGFGDTVNPQEDWQVTLRVDTLLSNIVTQSGRNQFADGMRLLWVTHMLPQYEINTPLLGVDVRTYGANGLEVKSAGGSYTGQGFWKGAVANASATAPQSVQACQTALVVSLITDRAGATGKGRIFLPWPNKSLGSADRRLSIPDATNAMDATRGLVDAINRYATSGPVVVASSKGFLSPVVGFRVGRVPDTHRSRRRRMPEAYVSRGLAAA